MKIEKHRSWILRSNGEKNGEIHNPITYYEHNDSISKHSCFSLNINFSLPLFYYFIHVCFFFLKKVKQNALEVFLGVTVTEDGRKMLGDIDVVPNIVKIMGEGGVRNLKKMKRKMKMKFISNINHNY